MTPPDFFDKPRKRADPTPADVQVLAEALRDQRDVLDFWDWDWDAQRPSGWRHKRLAVNILAALAERGYGVEHEHRWTEVDSGTSGGGYHGHPPDIICDICGAEQHHSLDAAFAAAEAALPEGWSGPMVRGVDDGTYQADAYDPTTGDLTDGEGSTPAAALNALAAQLSQAGRKP